MEIDSQGLKEKKAARWVAFFAFRADCRTLSRSPYSLSLFFSAFSCFFLFVKMVQLIRPIRPKSMTARLTGVLNPS